MARHCPVFNGLSLPTTPDPISVRSSLRAGRSIDPPGGISSNGRRQRIWKVIYRANKRIRTMR
jgi:hypothetical protein